MSGGAVVESQMSSLLRHGPRARVMCHTYRDRGPILAIYADRVSVDLLQVNPARVADRDVRFARSLLSAVQTYVSECERLAVEHGKDAA